MPTAPAPAGAPAEVPAFAGVRRIDAPVGRGPQKDAPAGSSKEKPQKPEALRVGAMIGLGFPRPFAVEGLLKVRRLVGFGVEYSFMPDAKFVGADVRFRGMAADLRFFPFKDSFFIGLRGGRQWLEAKVTIPINIAGIGSLDEAMSARTWFLNPRIGFLKTWDSGLTLGIDAGVQIPIDPRYVRSSDIGQYVTEPTVEKTLLQVANVLGNRMTPTVDLFRLGFLF